MENEIKNLREQKNALISKLRGFYNRSSRGESLNLTLSKDEMNILGTVRKELSVDRVKRILEDKKFTYNPRRWYTIEWEEDVPYLVITDYYLAPIVINKTRLGTTTEVFERKLYSYIAQEMQIIVDRMMSP